MLVQAPSLIPKLVFQKLDEFLAELEGLEKPLKGGVAVYGSAAAYALVWEFGALNMTKPGPKTVWGTNPYGERVILTKTAPEGYISIHQEDLQRIIVDEMRKYNFIGKTADETRLKLEIVCDNISQRWARVISDSAPVDTGDLRSQIQYVESNDPLLDMNTSAGAEAEATLLF